ncbi:tetratricopeptide repeat protein [Treponema endosymbiont of Eucomonympha sp.]|uniref:tetratricopeptide repeat protein n=1 Tax=Treponema endosymbiont of Eucomonympha sp. TaxID=1580831 RepID=UPI000A670FD5|nr:tetratricopeptide repeat protein [Treponema endosymbiont of Eucomonympha sp.]
MAGNSGKLNAEAAAFFEQGNARYAQKEYGAAIEAYTKATELQPDYAEAFYNRGVVYSNKGDYGKAIADFDAAIELKPNDAEAFHNRGVAYSDTGDHDKAIADFDAAIRLKPDYAEAFYNRGVAYGNKGDYGKAIADYTETIRLNPNITEAFYNRGNAYSDTGDHGRAIADFTEATRLQPDYASAFHNRGVAYSDTGDHDKAIADFDAAIRLKPDYAEAFHNRGFVYEQKGDYGKAIADYTEAIRLNPDYAEAFNNRGGAYEKKDEHDKAIADFGEAIRLKPKNAKAFNNRGVAYGNKGDYDRAATDYTQAIKLDPNLAPAYNNRGNTYLSKSDYGKAIADFDAAIELKPDYVEAFHNRGNAYFSKGEYDKAIADFDKAIELKPKNAKAFNNRGVAYGNKGDYDRAAADYTQAIKLDPNLAPAYNNRGNTYLSKSDYNNAIADFDATIRLKPDDAGAFHNRGVAYIGLEKYTKAFEDYLTAVEKGFSGTGDAIIDAVFKNQPDLLWSADYKRLDAAPHYFLRLIAFCIKQRRTTKEYQNLITAVYSLWNALRCKQDDTGHIYQYTSLRVLENERVTRRFRLTPAGYQNDPEEGKVFYDRLKASCNANISTVLDSIKSNSETVAFIRSFTTLEDTLFMWDSSYAAHGEGSAVGIAKQKINKGFGIDSLSREMSLPAQSLEMPLNTLIKGKTDNPQTDAVKDVSKNYDVVPTQEKTEQPKESAAEGESKKPVSVPMSSIGLYWVLYIGKTSKGKDAAVQAALDKLDETEKALKALESEFSKEDAAEKEQFIDFLSKLFTPVAHLIKKETYKHEEEYRLLYVSSISDATVKNYIHEEKTEEGVFNGIFIETEAILFEDSTEKDIVYFGPKVNEITRLKYEHAFRHKGLTVDFRQSNIHYR